MKNRIFAAALVCLGFFSCRKTETTVKENTSGPEVYTKMIQECYSYSKGRDTIRANVTIEGDSLSGELAYKFFEKDKSSGSFVGRVKGDTLIGDYTFQSEGTTSTRQVVFLRKNNSMVEGHGESEEKGGKLVFKDLKKLDFGGPVVLDKIVCK